MSDPWPDTSKLTGVRKEGLDAAQALYRTYQQVEAQLAEANERLDTARLWLIENREEMPGWRADELAFILDCKVDRDD